MLFSSRLGRREQEASFRARGPWVTFRSRRTAHQKYPEREDAAFSVVQGANRTRSLSWIELRRPCSSSYVGYSCAPPCLTDVFALG